MLTEEFILKFYRGGFKGVWHPDTCLSYFFAATGVHPLIFAETWPLTVCGLLGAAAFLLRMCLRPVLKICGCTPVLYTLFISIRTIHRIRSKAGKIISSVNRFTTEYDNKVEHEAVQVPGNHL